MAFAELRADEYAALSARALGRLVADGRVSPVQLVELALALAKASEPRINAYVSFLEPLARSVAQEREREARAGHLRSALHGVPIAVKDNFYLKGFPLARGSRTSPDYMPNENAPMVQRLIDAGTIIIGKTTTPEFGWKGTGISPLTGITRNPWNAERNSGGSSAGSAATVAAGAVPIALGTDAGGSIRIPAAFCGVPGFKPTLGTNSGLARYCDGDAVSRWAPDPLRRRRRPHSRSDRRPRCSRSVVFHLGWRRRCRALGSSARRQA